MLTLYAVRHGNTENNWHSKIMGQIDTPLTKTGLKNAQVLAQELREVIFDHTTKLQDVTINHIYTSDLGRSFITGYLIAQRLSLEEKLVAIKDLREVNYGIYANLSKEEVQKQCPEYKTDASYVFPQGESFYDMQKRVMKFITTLEEKHEDKNVLVVAHAGVLRAIICAFHNWDLQNHLRMRISHEYVGKFVIDKSKLVEYKKVHE